MYGLNHGFLHPHQLTEKVALFWGPFQWIWTTDLHSEKSSQIQPKKLSFLSQILTFRSWQSLNKWLEDMKLFKTMNKDSSEKAKAFFHST